MTKKEIIKIVISVLIAALTALAAGLGLSSCNVTRTVTTRSEAWQKGDTSVVIQTKTVESYDGTNKFARRVSVRTSHPKDVIAAEGNKHKKQFFVVFTILIYSKE